MFTRKVLLRLALAFTTLAAPVALLAQAVNGTILGTVSDSTGATVGNAKVSAVQSETGATRETVTNESGNYTMPDLPPGTYSVTVVAQGFKKDTRENIALLNNTSTRVDIDLSTGSITETVLVTTAPPLLQTDRADISTKIEQQQVSDLPLGTNRNFQSLLNLVPGTTPATFQHSQFFNAQSALQTQANGIPRMGNLYQIEGIDDDERTGLLQIIIPPAEAIQTVDISTNNFEAELGRAIGAVTNVTLKSGSNAFHGSAFEFIQNSAVDARSYFGGPLGHLSYNYFGGSIGGPILKDKLFFFGDYLRTSDHEAIANTFTLPPTSFYTPNAQGFIDLSGPLAGGKGQIYDPATGNPDGSNRTPFANNQIPFTRVNPVSLAILKLLPTPNQNQSNVSAPTNNFVTNLPFRKTTDSFDVKIDYTLTQKSHLSGRYSWQRVLTYQQAAFGAFAGGPAGGGFQGTGNQRAYSTGVNFDHVFSPTLFTEFRFGVAHLHNDAQPSDYGSNDATSLGIPGVNINPFTSGQVGIFVGNLGQQGQNYPLIGYSASVPWIRAEANIDFVNNWTKVIRNHSVKFGVDLRRVRDDLLQDQTFSPRGAYTFGENQTASIFNGVGTSTNVANDMASFLLDLPSQSGRDLNTFFPAYRQWWLFAFGSDKWQVTPKLTVDLGVRWEFYPPATPKIAGGFSNYDPSTNSLILGGVGSNPSNLGIKTRYAYFAPRTGFSYRATENTVIRGGFGISYTPFPDNNYAYNYPVRANNSFQPGNTYGPALLSDGSPSSFQKGFPGPVPIVIPSNGIISAPISQQYNVIPTNYYNPYVESWNVAVQQALPGSLSFQLAYVANHGVHMPVNQNINNPRVLGGGVASEPENILFKRTAATNAVFLGFSSNYQSLQAQLNRRFSKGLSLTTAFTWSKALNYASGDDGGLLFFSQLRRNYAPADFDRRLNYEQSFTYELPAGRGHRYFSSGPAQFVLGGWKASGIISVVSGLPFTVNANGGSLNTPGTTQTANLVGPFRVLHGIGAANKWFDASAFGQPVGVVTGSTGRNQFYGPGYIQDNLSLFKSFTIFREASIETRIDAFQLSNTPQFGNPNTGTLSASNFGSITTTLGSGQGSVNGIGGGRSLQASAKISF